MRTDHFQAETALGCAMPMPRLSGTDAEQKRLEIRDYFNATSDLYERLFETIADERGFFTKAISLRHPLIFYYAHTAVFFVNKLYAGGYIKDRPNPAVEAMTAVGVDEMSWDDLDEANYAWPSVTTVRTYRRTVRDLVNQFIDSMPLALPIDWDSPAWVILMGIEHERIHLETSSVLMRQLPIAWVRPTPEWPHCDEARTERAAVPHNALLPIPAGTVDRRKNDDVYGWDNEYGGAQADVAPFEASAFLVSNAEYHEFVAAHGYRDKQWWDEEGWRWRVYSDAAMPEFWVGETANPDALRLRVLAEEIPMPWDWPVEVNQLEASAFCRWKSHVGGVPVQLPSEDEWSRLRAFVPGDQPDWKQVPGNIDLAYWASSCPIDRFPQGTALGGSAPPARDPQSTHKMHSTIYDIVGNVWQWTRTPIQGFDGFKVHPLYDDFSTPTFDGKHFLMKGGSWISTGNEALRAARYAFRRHFFQHAGLRYVRSDAKDDAVTSVYETDSMVSQYLDFHYGPTHFGVPNYMSTLVDIALPFVQNKGSALDIGCATGRACIELAQHFDAVTGMDNSARFIDVAGRILQGEQVQYAVPIEGELLEHRQLRGPNPISDAPLRADIRFVLGDACNLKASAGVHDLVLAANLIDRLRDPMAFLQGVAPLVRAGGILLLASPYTWLESFTDRANWLGGKRENGEVLTTYSALQAVLGETFEEVVPATDVPFVIRETARKFQHTVAQVTIWRKRG